MCKQGKRRARPELSSWSRPPQPSSLNPHSCTVHSTQMLCLLQGRILNMFRNLARQISHDLHSDCFAMVLTAGFYCDSQTHNVRKVRVVKYISGYGQIKAADQKYCNNQRWRRNLKEMNFRTIGFWDNLDDFWPRYCRQKDLDLSRVVEAYSLARKNMHF